MAGLLRDCERCAVNSDNLKHEVLGDWLKQHMKQRCIYYRTCTAHAAPSPRASGKWGVKVQRDVLDVFPGERRCRSLLEHTGALLYGISARALMRVPSALPCRMRA